MSQSEIDLAPGFPTPLKAFLVGACSAVALNLAAPFVSLPLPALPWVSLAVTFLALGLPIYTLFRGAEFAWTAKTGWACVGLGVAFQALTIAASKLVFGDRTYAAAICLTVGQIGLLTWCLGAGGLVSRIIRECNLLVPVAIFLAALDMLLVLTPTGLTRMILNAAPNVLGSVGYAVPKVASAPTVGAVRQLAYVGPADLLFLAMFFASLHKFGMRSRATVIAMVPTLFVYLLVVLLFGWVSFGRVSLGALPALVPIGAVVLIVNAGLFKLTKEEIGSTLLVTALVVGLLVFFATRPVHVKTVDEQGRPVPTTDRR